MKYRKKPVEIKAWQFTRSNFENGVPKPFNHPNVTLGYSHIPNELAGKIQTLEGVMTARENDWIIQGVNGEFYPCKPDIFEKTYEKVED
ncbi:hypothetical protein M8868_11460 [Pasteurella multocida]|uniref:hypothetical protein n=1 Tax=Pasteurella TaxID=745 RepID=UPI00076CBED1|nr:MULTISPECIES: hypothetical protein [Pasteurella]AWB55776.1 hypothetical protein pm9n_09355 [Pasteurella multocida]KWW10600.1 hypothetical protein VM82_09645 [Pasteurella multocida]MCL7761738.1 hypothetical protein [Pasteurella multocida]MCL7772560.1 hypothetical protein [Pasteurella multocida]MCL7783487.1 hypothetical protein [Pasteurella multocida]